MLKKKKKHQMTLDNSVVKNCGKEKSLTCVLMDLHFGFTAAHSHWQTDTACWD